MTFNLESLAIPRTRPRRPPPIRASPRDLAEAIAFALGFEGRKPVHQADEYMAVIAAERCASPSARGFRRHEEAAGNRRRGAGVQAVVRT
jgi:hypothetical protein